MIVPDDGLDIYPLTLTTLYEYDPFGTLKIIVFVLDDFVIPPNVTDQFVPDGNPFS